MSASPKVCPTPIQKEQWFSFVYRGLQRFCRFYNQKRQPASVSLNEGGRPETLSFTTVRPVERPGPPFTSFLPAPLFIVLYKNFMFSLSFCSVPAKVFIFLPDFAKQFP